MRPIFETPRLDDITPATGVQKGFFGSVAAGFEAQRSFDNFNAEGFLRDRVWRDYLTEVEARTGERLPHPDDFIAQVDLPALLGATDEDGNGIAGAKARYVLDRIDELRAANPGVEIPGPDWMDARLRSEAADIQSAASQAGGLGAFIGAVGGAFTDPATLATAPIGGAQKTILRAVGVEAAVNALLETANIPVANRWREELGVDTMDLGEAAGSVAIAAVAGGALGGAAKAAETGLPRAFNRLSNSRLAQAVRDLGGDNPERRALADALEREAEIEASNPFPEVDADLHGQRLQDAVMVLNERGTERAVAAAARLAEEPPAPDVAPDLPGGLQALDPRDLEVDAARFQFKTGGDADGVTDRLAGVTEWDPVRAGIAIVFEQQDGRRFIADGHQRRGLAARLLDADPARDIRLTAFVYREADGWSDGEIRALAAAKNLAEGTGTAIDAAKILRADPALLDGSLPMRGALIRDAQGLMTLGDDAFGAVINEVVPANYGAIVGRLVSDPDEQLAVLEQLARAEVRNAFEAEALVRGAVAAGFARREGATGSLFGEIPTESLVADRARVLSRAVSILRKEKTVFSTLAREADRIESAGNRLARDTNAQRAKSDGELVEILQTLAHRSGPVADALNARTRQSDGNAAAAARKFVGDLRDLVEDGDLSRLLAGGSRRDAGPAAPGGGDGAPARVEGQAGLDLEPGRFDGGPDDPAMAGQAENLAPAGAGADAADEGGFLDGSQIEKRQAAGAPGDPPGSVRAGDGGVRGPDRASEPSLEGDARAPQGQAPELLDPDADEFDTALIFDPGEGPRRERVTAADVEAEIAADDAAVERLRSCVPK